MNDLNGIGVVIVTYNSARVIGNCLDACRRANITSVAVVDNNSADGTCDIVRRHSGIRLIRNDANRGFAAAVNQGVKALDRPLILLLNPDAELMEGAEAMARTCSEAGVAAVGGKLIGTDGAAQQGFSVRRLPTPAALIFESLGINRLWPGNPVNRRYRCLDLDLNRPADAEQPAGAFLMFRRDVWQELGGFDERFWPAWFEDVDFCVRTRLAGYSIRYEPAAIARHIGAHSVGNLPWSTRQVYWYGNLLSYAAKHFGWLSSRAVIGSVLAGCLARVVVGSARQRSLRPLLVWCKVVRLAGRLFFSSAGRRSKSRNSISFLGQAHIHVI